MRRFISLIKFSSLPLLFLPQPTGQSAFGRVVLKYSFQSLNTQKLLPGKLSSAFLRETGQTQEQAAHSSSAISTLG